MVRNILMTGNAARRTSIICHAQLYITCYFHTHCVCMCNIHTPLHIHLHLYMPMYIESHLMYILSLQYKDCYPHFIVEETGLDT